MSKENALRFMIIKDKDKSIINAYEFAIVIPPLSLVIEYKI